VNNFEDELSNLASTGRNQTQLNKMSSLLQDKKSQIIFKPTANNSTLIQRQQDQVDAQITAQAAAQAVSQVPVDQTWKPNNCVRLK